MVSYDIRIVIFLLFSITIVKFSMALTPTPTCNPSYIEARFEPDNPDPTYFPEDIITLQIAPKYLSDWPTTPTGVLWAVGEGGAEMGQPIRSFTIPNPAPDTFRVSAGAYGDPIRIGCPSWGSSVAVFTARRYDYIPPTPTQIGRAHV